MTQSSISRLAGLALAATVAEQLDAAVEAARAMPEPPVSAPGDFVVRPRPTVEEPPPVAVDAPVFRTMDAIRTALAPGAMCTQVQAPRNRGTRRISDLRMDAREGGRIVIVR